MMGFLGLFNRPDINRGLAEYRNTPGAVLLDVRMPLEYQQGHIPGSKNIPLPDIMRKGPEIADRDTPLFVYCHSGVRSRQAVDTLARMGYSNAKNIGGIAAYTGKVER